MNPLKNKLQVFATVVFLGFLVWWISFQHVVTKGTLSNQWYGSTYGVVALIGAIIGFIAAQKFGGFKTTLGKALMFFSIGLLGQEIGQAIYTYYILVSKIQIPYPSWGDAGYFGSTLSYLVGTMYLLKTVGAKFSLKKLSYKIIALIIPLLLLIVSYLVFIHNHPLGTTKPLTVFLDLGYPIGEALYISVALVAFLLSRKLLGGVMRAGILFLIVALCVEYASDFTFLYQSSRNIYVPGADADLLYLIAYFVMTTTMIKFRTIYNNISSKTKTTSAQANTETGEA